MDIDNVTINLFDKGEFDIQTFIEQFDNFDILRLEMNNDAQQSASFFPSNNLYTIFMIDL